MTFLKNPAEILDPTRADRDLSLLNHFISSLDDRWTDSKDRKIWYCQKEVSTFSPYKEFTIHVGRSTENFLGILLQVFLDGTFRLICENCRTDDADNPCPLSDDLIPFIETDWHKPYIAFSDTNKCDELLPPVIKYIRACVGSNPCGGWSYPEIQLRSFLWRNDCHNWVNWYTPPRTKKEFDLGNEPERILIEYHGDYYHGTEFKQGYDKSKMRKIQTYDWSVIWAWEHALIYRGEYRRGFYPNWDKVLTALHKVRAGQSFVEIDA